MYGIGYAAEIDDGRRFLQEIQPDNAVAIVFRGDAESECAAAIIARTLGQMGDELVFPIYIDKAQSLGDPNLGRRIAARNPSRMIVVGMSGPPTSVLPGLRTMILDDHRPNGTPSVDLFATTYDADPPAPLTLLAYEICKGLLFYDGCEWLAALGIAAHSGVGSDFEILRGARERYGEHVITETLDLLNAGHRSPKHDLATVYEVLMEAESPIDISSLTVRGGEKLEGYRSEVESELRRVMRDGPVTSAKWAMLDYTSPAMLEDMVADAIAEDAPEKGIVAANHGYIVGKVSFRIVGAHSQTRSAIHTLLDRYECEESSTGQISGIIPHREFIALMERLDVKMAEAA